jgi:hypothetical protein
MRSHSSLVWVATLIALGCATELDNPNAFQNPNGGAMGTAGSAGSAGAAGAAGAAGTAGAAGSAGAAGTAGGTGVVCDAPATIFSLDGMTQGGCQGASCHSTGAIAPDLQAADIPGRLRGVAGTFCPSGKFIDATTPANSLLVTKLQASNTCSQRMPFALPPLDDTKIQCVADWVNSVAAP